MVEEQLADAKTVSEVVSKAVVRAADDMGLNGCQLAKVIGLSEATVSRIRRGSCTIGAGTKTYEMVILLIRIHQSLVKILGADKVAIRSWMSCLNTELKAVPAEKIRDIRGLVAVTVYTEMRATNH